MISNRFFPILESTDIFSWLRMADCSHPCRLFGIYVKLSQKLNYTYSSLTLCLLELSGLIWIQNIYTLMVPERSFRKSWLWKKSADEKKNLAWKDSKAACPGTQKYEIWPFKKWIHFLECSWNPEYFGSLAK